MMRMEFRINLQLFAGEKTERATPRRREEARKKGQVAKSVEINTVLGLVISLLVLRAWLPSMMQEFNTFFTHVFTYAAGDLTLKTTVNLLMDIILVLVKLAGPLLLAAMVAGYAANVLQIGFLFTSETLKFDLNRLNPVKGMQRIFSKRALAELIKSLLKTCLVGYVAVSFLLGELPGLGLLMDIPVDSALIYIGDITFSAGWRILAILFVLAVADYGYQVYEYEQSLKMSKQEIKEEYKNIEGDPQLRAKLRERQRQLATRRMMQEVPKATVVITNPTHVAVALKYSEEMSAPELVAKGQDYLAQRIKEVAADNEVAIVENRSLAWLIYEKVGIGKAIPVDLYQAVAEVIAYVYKLKKQ